MSDLLKIKITIADRVYPLTIRRAEEENIRAAAKKVEQLLRKYEEGYAVRDKQDVLAMGALQLASQWEKLQRSNPVDGKYISDELQRLELKVKQAVQ